MKLVSALTLIVLFSACADSENQVKDLRDHATEVEETYTEDDTSVETMENSVDTTNAIESTSDNSEWSYKVTFISDHNWGYQIFQKDKMMINQTTIPSVQGIDGFDTEEKARRTAEFILTKLENGIFPPTVNKEDLEKLEVLRD